VTIDDRHEWLEADGLGGFASGTTSGIRTRRYHALLLTATTPPTGRVVLVNGFDAWIDTAAGSFALSTQRYAPDVLHPDGHTRIRSFSSEPWPTWEFELPDGRRVVQEIVVRHDTPITMVVWRLVSGAPATLRVRPFLSGRDYHATHHENGVCSLDAEVHGASVVFQPYQGLPRIVSSANGTYRNAPEWYRQFLYTAERDRGLDAVEDLASPGELTWTLDAGGADAVWTLTAAAGPVATVGTGEELLATAARHRADERARRSAFRTPLDRAADAYLVRRGRGRTVIAGYPWFADWGRDTFIAIRGLCLATGRYADARDILVEWAGAVSEGMLPNRFPDHGDTPQFNSVDASLWYVLAVDELLQRAAGDRRVLSTADAETLATAISRIVSGYAAGTRYGIRMDHDGLLASGAPGVQLTWMDARVGDRVITPRIGKPVEIQALWLNAVQAAGRSDARWRDAFERGRAAFVERFWIEERGYLADVVDVDHVPGTRDLTLRPNQILAVGGLPVVLLDGDRARRMLDVVERRLLTPIGLRSLDPGDSAYAARYEGDASARDAVYHQGTVWPWLAGPFVEAWIRVRGNTAAVRREARETLVASLMRHLDEAGLGHVSEIADAEPPFVPRGCPFQAWSLGELLRLDRVVLADPARTRSAREALSHAAETGRAPRVGAIRSTGH